MRDASVIPLVAWLLVGCGGGDDAGHAAGVAAGRPRLHRPRVGP